MNFQRAQNLVIIAGWGLFTLFFIVYTIIRYRTGTPDHFFINYVLLSVFLSGFFLFVLFVSYTNIPRIIANRRTWLFIQVVILLICFIVLFGPLLVTREVNSVQFFFLVVSLICLGLIIYRYLSFIINPLSAEERSDPLEREIVIGLPYEETFALCEQALSHTGIWTIKSIEKKNGTLEAWPSTSHVSIRIESINPRQNRVRIRSVFDGDYTRFPEIEQRRNIHNVEKIMAYLKNRSSDHQE